jgi:phosphate-selective porin
MSRRAVVFFALLLVSAAHDRLLAQERSGGLPAGPAAALTTQDDSQKAKVKKGGKTSDPGLKLVWKDRPSIRAGDWLRIDIRGLLHADLRESEQDLSEEGGAFALERARIGIKGNVTKYVEYEVTRDFANGGAWQDVYVNLRPVSFVQVLAGRFKMPFSLERLTSPAELDFVYRTLGSVLLAPGRDVGLMAHARVLKRVVHYQVGFFEGDGENLPRRRTG